MRLLITLLLILSPVLVIGQSKSTDAKQLEVPLVKVPIGSTTTSQLFSTPDVMDPLQVMVLAKQIRDEVTQEMQSQLAAACDERQLAIDKMKLEIECRGITPEELGFNTNCDTLGLYSEWIVKYCSPTPFRGQHLTWLDPATPLTTRGPSGTKRDHALVGFNKYIAPGTRIYMTTN